MQHEERRGRAEYGDFDALRRADAQEAARRAHVLREMLDGLDDPLRETALLVLDHDLSHAEAAAIFGVSEGTISWRLHVPIPGLYSGVGLHHEDRLVVG